MSNVQDVRRTRGDKLCDLISRRPPRAAYFDTGDILTMIELSTRFTGISTATTKSGRLSMVQAIAKAKAHLRYIDRATATKNGDVLAAGPLTNTDGSHLRTRSQGRAAIRRAIEARATRGGQTGARIAEKLMFSLPNDFSGKPAREALDRILKCLIGDSDAVAFAVIHTDRPNNLHCHIIAVDGPESIPAARKRRPSAKRVRRQDHLRMNERGRPKELRQLIAAEINAVADRYKLTRVEYRSFEDRGITREPGSHLGPQQIARNISETAQRLRKRISAGRTPAQTIQNANRASERVKSQKTV